MVNAGQPQCGVALHPLVAGQNILQSGVQGVAHMQLTSYIGGRHHDGKGLLVLVDLAFEVAALHPHVINLLFDRFRVIGLGELAHHIILLKN